MHIPASLRAIFELIGSTSRRIYFPASYRTQKVIRETGLALPQNVAMVDPIGYEEMLCLMVNSRGVITDSGTVVEETCVLQVPSLQMRKSTERPQVYDVGSSVKFDPDQPDLYPAAEIFRKMEALVGKNWQQTLGDGRSSERIAADLHRRVIENDFARHRPEHYHIPIERSYRPDGL